MLKNWFSWLDRFSLSLRTRRVKQSNEIASSLTLLAMTLCVTCYLLLTTCCLYAGGWEQLKVKGKGGDTTVVNYPDAIAVDPNDGNTIYIASPYGILKSVDGGNKWESKYFLTKRKEKPPVYYTFESGYERKSGQSFGDGPSALDIGAQAEWTGTYDQAGIGVSRTTIIPVWYGVHILPRKLIVDPRDSKTIYANVRSAGVFVSKDAGETWAYYIDAFNRNNEKGLVFTRIAVDPTQPDTIWATEGPYLYRLRNGKSSEPKPIVIGVPCDEKGIEIPQPLGKISFKGNYVKPEPGQNYVLLYPPAERPKGGGWLTQGCRDTASFFVRALCCDPTQPDTLYISVRLWCDRSSNEDHPPSQELAMFGFKGGEGKGGLYRSTDGGNSWSRLPFKGSPGIIKTFPTQPGKVFVNCKGKWSVSSDSGNTWSTLKLGGITGIAPFLAFHPKDSNIIYGRTLPAEEEPMEKGYHTIEKTEDGGKTWSPLGAIGKKKDKDFYSVVDLFCGGDKVYALVDPGWQYRSNYGVLDFTIDSSIKLGTEVSTRRRDLINASYGVLLICKYVP